MKLLLLVVACVLGVAMGARRLHMADEYPLLQQYQPLYNVLNVTGWEDYPEGCWVFPLPAINLVMDAEVYLLAAETGPDDTSDGLDVATAWCESLGFDAAGEMQLHSVSEGQLIRNVQIGTGDTCEAVGGPAGTGAPCTVFTFIECIKGAATKGCGLRFTTNNGVDNRGYGNNVGWVSGATNTGNFNNGSSNLGDWNLGSANLGSFNDGSANYGNCNTGSAMKGDFVACPGAY